jgi:hypothetical protein
MPRRPLTSKVKRRFAAVFATVGTTTTRRPVYRTTYASVLAIPIAPKLRNSR